MGLREQNARRTRAAIADVALRLFEEQGYEATTMEQIAQAADVGTSTLYRYFPTKDSTLLDRVFLHASPVAELLAERPPDEPLGDALGHALAAHLQALDRDIENVARVRLQIDRNPAVRARVWDIWARHQAHLEQAIADRVGADPDTLDIQVTAHITQMVVQMALDQGRDRVTPEPLATYAQQVVAALTSDSLILPRVP